MKKVIRQVQIQQFFQSKIDQTIKNIKCGIEKHENKLSVPYFYAKIKPTPFSICSICSSIKDINE